MSFLHSLKSRLNNVQYRRGSNGDVLVNSRDLKDLIYHFERIDSEFRALYEKKHMLMSAKNKGKSCKH